MVNDAIRLCIKEGIHSRLKLRDRIYKEFQERYRVVSVFPYSVAEVAWSIMKKNRRWNRRPFARRLMMKMDVRSYSLNYSVLSLPFRRGERVLIALAYGEYQRSFLMDNTLKRGSVTLTDTAVIIAFTKSTCQSEPLSKIGIDLNEKSVVCSNGTKYDLSEVARLHTEYGTRRSTFNEKHSRDQRVKNKFASSRREKARVRQFLHRKAKEIVEAAEMNKQAIILERLKGIRYSHQKGNGEGKRERRRIAQWPFRVLQALILYKASWEGIPVEFVSAAYTSKTCNKCRYINRGLKLTEREWRCPSCGAILDRDLNAAINIERRGKIACLGEVRPGAQGTEAVKGNPTTPVILRAEALKSTNSAGLTEP
jgi:putative transposase